MTLSWEFPFFTPLAEYFDGRWNKWTSKKPQTYEKSTQKLLAPTTAPEITTQKNTHHSPFTMRLSKYAFGDRPILFLISLMVTSFSANADTGASGNKSGPSSPTNSVPAAIAPSLSTPIIHYPSQVDLTADSIDSLRQKAEAGDAEAQTKLGEIYRKGDGVEKDVLEAAKWYRKAADQGYVDAQMQLGVCYHNGDGVKKDLVEAAKWYREAADQGNTDALAKLGACYSLGQGVQKNVGQAAKWFSRAAEQGDAFSQWWLGWAYRKGTGVEKNEVEAAYWYRKAAEQGYAYAQLELGADYASGNGVEKDNGEAFRWFHEAADHGLPQAELDLGLCFEKGSGIDKDDVEAAKWYSKAAERGLAQAQGLLGLRYIQGVGVIKNEPEGIAWLYVSNSNGDGNAANILNYEERHFNASVILQARERARELQAQIASRTKAGDGGSSTATTAPVTPLPSGTAKASGSGAFISEDGFVLTAAHVVQGALKIEVVTSTGKIAATIVKIDLANDVALLKCDGINFTPLPIAASKTVRVGGDVFTLGFPNIQIQGFDPKLTKGEISSLAGIEDDPRDWQVSVPIQPGNSGGPLCDENGNLIGIVLSTLNPLAMAKLAGEIPQNVNYAVKSSYILPLLDLVKNLPALRTHVEGNRFEDVVETVRPSMVLILVY